MPNYYTLRHGGNYKADSLRTWDLQGRHPAFFSEAMASLPRVGLPDLVIGGGRRFAGSSDGKNWIVLKRHTNDTSLSGPFATHSWPIPSVTEAYRHFRCPST